MKTALIAAIVAAVVAAASGTAATIVVTSKNIKNGTIQTVDISAKAKRALKGQRGLRGPQGVPGQSIIGADGDTGPPGPQGPAGAVGPPGGLGPLPLWAVIAATGNKLRGPHVLSSSLISGGFYIIVFDQPVDTCAYAVTLFQQTGLVSVSTSAAADTLSVSTYSPGGAPEPRAFSLAVMC
jgi:hypothetical protein